MGYQRAPERNWIFLNHKYLRFKTWMCQNAFKEFLSAASKNQAQIQGHSEDYSQERRLKNKGLENIALSMNKVLDAKIQIYIWVSTVVKVYIWFTMTLYYKMWQILLQNATFTLLQNATKVYYKMCQVFYYEKWQFYYKIQQLLQNALVEALIIKQWGTTWKVSKYRIISGPYFPTFGLNTERYSVCLRIQSECGKIRTRNNSVFRQFSRSEGYSFLEPSNICFIWKEFSSAIFSINSSLLTHSFLMHPFSTPWKHQKMAVEKGCIGNEWVKQMVNFILEFFVGNNSEFVYYGNKKLKLF